MADYREAERLVGEWFEKEGYKVAYQPNNNPSYDLIVQKGSQRAVIQIKDLKSSVNNAQVTAFSRFLESKEGKVYNKGYFVCKNGFARTVYRNLGENIYSSKLILGLFFNDSERKANYPAVIHSIELYEEQKVIFEEFNYRLQENKTLNKTLRIAICTCKGGVGKTTVAAHLAGAFTLIGHETALVDCDPEHHLSKLLDPAILELGEGDGIILDETDKPLSCYIKEKWQQENKDSYPIVIYDCAPSKSSNDPQVFKQADFCIIPINLCPLGVGKNIDVLKDTFEFVRGLNPKIKCLILVNNRLTKEHKVAKALREKVALEAKECGARLIEPDIRHSEQLYFWGAEPRKLAFKEIGGKCYPKQDFTTLAEYLVRYFEISKKRN